MLDNDRFADADPQGDGEGEDLRIDEVEVSDEESVSQRRTLQRIQSLWDEIAEVRMAIARDSMSNEFAPQQRRKAYYSAVRNLWIELKPHLAAADEVAQERYLLDIDLGRVRIEPPDPLQPSDGDVFGRGLELLAGEAWPEPVDHPFEGFVDFEEASIVLSARWEVRLDVDTFETSNYREELLRRIQRTETMTGEKGVTVYERETRDFEEPFIVEKTVLLPRSVIETAFQALVELTHDLGLGVQLGTGEDFGAIT